MLEVKRTDSIIYFFHRDYVGDEGRWFFRIGKATGGTLLGRSFANPLPEELSVCFAKYGACADCGASVNATLDPGTCGATPDVGGHLKVVIFYRVGETTISDLLGREFERIKSKDRRNRMNEATVTLTDAEVALLFRLQRGLCFYCGEEFGMGKNGPMLQRDHYEALVAGGDTTLENIILACKLCNTRKGAMHGNEFSRLSARTRRDEVKSRYTAMRRQFRVGLARYLLRRQKDASGD